MSDIVERLRAEATDNRRYEVNGTLAVEAADLITALRAENERLRVENIQMQAALGYGILAEDERHILPSNPFKCGTCDANTALRAEVESRYDQFQQYARKMESDMNALAAQNERLRGVLAWFADEYDQMNFMRSADMHRAECRCLRCARDEARAALEERP